MTNRYWMTGGSGRLGSVLTQLLPVDAPSHRDVDILRPDSITAFAARHQYTAVIHLAAISNASDAEKHPHTAYRTNVIGTRNVAEAAVQRGLKVYYVSTDYVFDGVQGNYGEEDTPRPANWYGATKYAGELEIQEAGGRFGIIRTSFRPNDWGFPTAYTNVYTTADYTDVIARELAECIKRDVDGVLHVGTPVKTFFELARLRTADVKPEECTDPRFPKRRNLNIEKWLAMKKESPQG